MAEVVSDASKTSDIPRSAKNALKSENPPVEEDDTRTSSNGNGQTVAPVTGLTAAKAWVQFEDENAKESPAAVIAAESVQVNLERSFSENLPPSASSQAAVVVDPKNLRNVELPVNTSTDTIRQGFANGDIIVTLLPVNTSLPWITSAKFRPELVPEELMAQGLTLTVEEYVQIMELLVNDYRFTLYNVCYKRVLAVWILLAFILLISMLLSGLSGLVLFGVGIFWLVINATAIFLSMWVKFKLQRQLERCLANVNKHLLRHKILIALDDRGKISCHKIALCFIYLDPSQCINHLQTCIDVQERDDAGWEQRMDIGVTDIVIHGSRTTRLSRKQSRAEYLLMRYLQRWGKDYLRHRLDWTSDETMNYATCPRHIMGSLCPCQYVEEVMANKAPQVDVRDCCPAVSRIFKRFGLD